jgi:hypothetical protein
MALLTRINEDQKNLMDLYKEMKGDYQKLLLKMDHIEESLDISRYLPTTTTTRSQLPQQCTPQPPTATSSLPNNPGPAVPPISLFMQEQRGIVAPVPAPPKGNELLESDIVSTLTPVEVALQKYSA